MALPDDTAFPYEGRMDWIDNELDPGPEPCAGARYCPIRSCFSARASSDACDLMGSAPYEAMLLPDSAIGSDQSRKIVYVVGKNDVVELREVKLGRLIDGLRVLHEGLKPDETVVISRAATRSRGRARHSDPQADRGHERRGSAAVNLSRLSIDQPVLAIVASIFILVVGAIAYSAAADSGISGDRSAAVVIQTSISRCVRAGRGRHRRHPDRAGGERRRRHAVHVLAVDLRRRRDHHRHLQARHRSDKAQVLVRNAVSIAEPRLPEEVRRFGVVTKKNSPNLMLVVLLMSPDDTYDQLYISNYALRRVRDLLLRLDGVGDIRMYGARDYSMRLWLDPDKMAEFGLAAADLLASVRSQNVQIAGGQIAEPPISDRAFQPNLTSSAG